MPRRIAVDAMGGDLAPAAEIEGCLLAVQERDLEVVLVGDRARLAPELERRGRPARITVHHASQVIAMSDHPATAVRSKKDASMRVCFDLARAGQVDAVVSAGHSGAMLACGLFVMKRIRGVDRPGIITLCPTPGGGHAVVLDVGANTEAKAIHLAQYAVMGATYARLLLGIRRPRVAVLSNGEEETKGTSLTREAHRLLRGNGNGNGGGNRSSDGADGGARDFDFVGYVEGRDFFSGIADVVVTDGFTGNVALKTSEGTTRAIASFLKQEAARSWRVKLGAALMRPAFDALKRLLEPDEYGGAPLLGVDGVAIICHGRSSATAIKNGIFTAERFVKSGIAEAIAQAIHRHQPLWRDEDAAPVSVDSDDAGPRDGAPPPATPEP